MHQDENIPYHKHEACNRISEQIFGTRKATPIPFSEAIQTIDTWSERNRAFVTINSRLNWNRLSRYSPIHFLADILRWVYRMLLNEQIWSTEASSRSFWIHVNIRPCICVSHFSEANRWSPGKAHRHRIVIDWSVRSGIGRWTSSTQYIAHH